MKQPTQPQQSSLFDTQTPPERAVLAQDERNAPIRPAESPAATAPQEPPTWADALAGFVAGRK